MTPKHPPLRPTRRAPPIPVHPITRWHRVTGIASTLIVVITVLTGLALNHGDALGLSRIHPHNALVDTLYRQSAASVPGGYATARGWITQIGAQVFRDEHAFTQRDAPLLGALMVGDTLYIAYRDGLVQYDAEGRVVDIFDALDGLLPPLTRVGMAGQDIVIATATGVLLFDVVQGTARATADPANVQWVTAAPLPAHLAAPLASAYRGDGVSYERVLLDLHSGRLFGIAGELVVDAAALCLLTLALTGTYMFFKFKRGAQRPPR